jgi:ABC-type amino acid transport substrate-binding protein
VLVSDVFVCHASEDRVAAEAAVVALEAQDHRCWIAPRDVPPGTDYAGAILSGISGSRLLLLIFSRRANESSHVPREVERAVHRGMPIIPFRLDDVEPSGPLEYFISGAQWLDATSGRPEEQLPALVEAVAALLAPEGPTPSETAGDEFSEAVREQLGTLIFRFGADLAQDPRRLQALLRDMVGDHPAEISALVTAAEEGVPETLLQSSDPGAEATMERLARRLKERRALGAEASRWAVASWADALRIPLLPSEPSLDPSEPRRVSDAAPEETRPVAPGVDGNATVPADSPVAPPAPAPEVKSIRDLPQPAVSQARTPPQPPPRTKRRSPWIYGLGAVVGAVIIVGALANLTGDDDAGPGDTTPAATDVTTTLGSATPTTAVNTTSTAVAQPELSAYSEEIIARGRVRIGVQETELPPLSSFETDLAQEIVRRLFGDIAIESVPLAVPDRFTTLEAGDIDFLIRNTTHTTGREELVTFTSPYFLDGLAFSSSTGTEVASIDGLAGQTVGVLGGSSLELDTRDALAAAGTGATVVPYADFQDLLNAVSSGEADALAVNWVFALNYEQVLGWNSYLHAPLEPLAIAVQLGQSGLRDDLDQTLREIMADGTWRELYALSFLDPPPWGESEVLSFPPVDR